MSSKQKRGVAGGTAGPAVSRPSPRKHGPQVPIAPIQEWCQAQIDAAMNRPRDPHDPNFGPCRDLAARLGVNDRVLNRIMRGVHDGARNGRKGEYPTVSIRRAYVEDMLHRAGVRFDEVYPAHLAYESAAALKDFGALRDAHGRNLLEGLPEAVHAWVLLAAEDIEIEPDGYCRCCREFVTPIGGVCPWDETPVSVTREWAA